MLVELAARGRLKVALAVLRSQVVGSKSSKRSVVSSRLLRPHLVELELELEVAEAALELLLLRRKLVSGK